MSATGDDEIMAELFADVRDMHFEQVGQAGVVLIKEMLVELGARNEFAMMQGKILNERVFASGQCDFVAGARNGASRGVNDDVANFQASFGFAGSAADESAQAREQFVEIERFNQVIVSAG